MSPLLLHQKLYREVESHDYKNYNQRGHLIEVGFTSSIHVGGWYRVELYGNFDPVIGYSYLERGHTGTVREITYY